MHAWFQTTDPPIICMAFIPEIAIQFVQPGISGEYAWRSYGILRIQGKQPIHYIYNDFLWVIRQEVVFRFLNLF